MSERIHITEQAERLALKMRNEGLNGVTSEMYLESDGPSPCDHAVITEFWAAEGPITESRYFDRKKYEEDLHAYTLGWFANDPTIMVSLVGFRVYIMRKP